jgi:hypothetical protein
VNARIHEPVWMSAPGTGHAPLEGHPHAGQPSLLNGIPHETLSLGVIAGREVVIEAESLEWLDELGHQLTLARSRLSMFLPRHEVHPLDGAA